MKILIRENKPVVFIDADSFPKHAVDLVLRMTKTRMIQLVLVANRVLSYEESAFIQVVCVEQSIDSADQWIRANTRVLDIVLTRDIVLAEILVKSGIFVLNHQGTIFDNNNITERRSLRDYRLNIILSGYAEKSNIHSNYGKKELGKLANSLDKILNYSLQEMVKKSRQEAVK